MVCPACREAVFKKTRSRPDGEITHFLSHHKATDDESRECELRVEAINRAREEQFNAEARGQTLTSFMGILRDQIEKVHQRNFPARKASQEIRSMLSREGFNDLMAQAKSTLKLVLIQEDPRAFITQIIADQKDYAHESPFWQRRQAAYVLDILRTLAQPQQDRNFRHLFAAVYLNMGWRLAGYRKMMQTERDIPGYDPIPAIRVLEALSSGKSRHGMIKATQAIISEGGRSPTTEIAQERMKALSRAIILEAMGPMVGMLAAIPFVDLAAGREPTPSTGVSPALQRLMEELMSFVRDTSEGNPSSKD